MDPWIGFFHRALRIFFTVFTVISAADVGQCGARAALRAGEIRPLSELLAQLERECVGDLIEIELDGDDGQWRYEIKLLGPRAISAN